MGFDERNRCQFCGAPFGRRDSPGRWGGNRRLCGPCGARIEDRAIEERRAARIEAAGREEGLLDALASICPDDAPEIETTEEELAKAMGEGPGPDDPPDLFCPAGDDDGPERLARVRRYAADIDRGQPIRFVPRERLLSRFEARTPAGAVDGPDRGRIGRQAGAGATEQGVDAGCGY